MAEEVNIQMITARVFTFVRSGGVMHSQRVLHGLLLSFGLWQSAPGQSLLPIIVDGEFGDWGVLEPAHIDPSGDASAGGVDFGGIWTAEDGVAVFFRVDFGRETLMQDQVTNFPDIGNDIRLLLDTDSDSLTGEFDAQANLGVDLEIRLGRRQVVRYPGGQTQRFQEIGFSYGPSWSVNTGEWRLVMGGNLSGTFRYALRDLDSGDRLPNAGFLEFSPGGGSVPLDEPIPLGKGSPDHLRILTWNTRNDGPFVNPAPFERVLAAVEPDIVLFQELVALNATESAAFVAAVLGGMWEARQQFDCVTVSRFPILDSAASFNNLVTHIDLPDSVSQGNLVLFNAHSPAGSDNAGRDDEHDAMAALWRDLLAGSGPFSIDAVADAAVFAGDFNLVGYRRHITIIRDGDIFDNGANGPDFDPGRGEGVLVFLNPRHSHARLRHTWRPSPTSSFGTGILDAIFYTGDVAREGKSYALDTVTLPPEVLGASGLLAGDSEASDHLPLIVDLVFQEDVQVPTDGWLVQ